MRLLFLSGARRYFSHKMDPFRDPSFIYRLHNPAISAAHLGHEVSIVHLLDLKNPFFSKNWDIAILHRPSFNSTFLSAINFLKKNKIPIFGDFDDLIFSLNHASERPSVKNGQETLDDSIIRVRKHLNAIEHIDGVIVSNQFLLKHIKKISKSPKYFLVMSNSWHLSWKTKFLSNTNIIKYRKYLENKEKFLTYFSGTRTHDLDLLMISCPLINVLNKHKNIKFKLFGKANLEENIKKISVIEKKIHFKKYHKAVSQSYVNLAPLENTPFNYAKSALKIIEAGFFGIKTVCSPNPDYLSTPVSTRNIARSTSEWEEELENAIELADDENAVKNICLETQELFNPLTTTNKMINDFKSIL